MAFIIKLEHGRWYVIATTPDMHLVIAVLGGSFTFVQTLQGTVMALIEPPVANHRNPHSIHLVEHQPQGTYRTLEDGCVRDIELVAKFGKKLSGSNRFVGAFFGQVDVCPARKQVF
jgi:hypothetical protein